MTPINVTMGLSRTVSEIEGDFSRKWQKNSNLLVFCAPLNWVPALEVKKTRMMWLPGRERSLTISSAVWIQYTINTKVTDGRSTDGRTDGRSGTDTAADSKNCAYA